MRSTFSAPEAKLAADCAVAFGGALCKVEVGCEFDCTTNTTPVIGLRFVGHQSRGIDRSPGERSERAVSFLSQLSQQSKSPAPKVAIHIGLFVEEFTG